MTTSPRQLSLLVFGWLLARDAIALFHGLSKINLAFLSAVGNYGLVCFRKLHCFFFCHAKYYIYILQKLIS